MGYLSIERLEGSYNLQEVVKDYIPRKHTVNYYDLNYLKIVRTPNCHKLVGSEIVGEDYSHYVYFWISVNQSLGLGKSYHGGKKFQIVKKVIWKLKSMPIIFYLNTTKTNINILKNGNSSTPKINES